MSALQWALLVLGAGIALLLVGSSLRERWSRQRETRERDRAPRRTAGQDWHDDPGAVPAQRDFDEFGVSPPRARRAPTLEPARNPLPPDDTVIALYIAEHEGTTILGPKIHAALEDQGLVFGARKIYHRLDGDQTAFSVASLVQPGALDPAEAEGFSTPGLSVFMVLPGPRHPQAAFENMLDTARVLARSLRAELFDTEQRQRLTPEREATLRRRVEDWVHRAGGAAGA